MKNLVILGAGTAGTMMANKLATRLKHGWRITIIDRDDLHLYQPGLLFLPFGAYREEDIVRSRRLFLPPEVRVDLSGIAGIDLEKKRVKTGSGATISYDVLIVATGTRLTPELTEGLTGAGWGETAFDFYSLEGALKLRKFLDGFHEGHLVLNIADMPIKCPVAPLEFVFLADAFFTERKLRDRVRITLASPLDSAFTKPRAAEAFGSLLEERNIGFEGNFAVESVDGEARTLRGYGDRSIDYDLLVSVPLHAGAEVVSEAGLGDDLGFVPTDKHTLRAKDFEDVFVLGDATDLPTSKAGSVAHFQAEVLIENVLRHVEGEELLPDFDGHANCFIETGHGKGILIDFNYETEPLPGKYPLPGIGPFDLLAESHVNHWGKLAFKWAYWSVLLKGQELPIDHRMLMAGKRGE